MAAGCEDWGAGICASARTLSMRAIVKTQIFLGIFTFRPLNSGKVTTSHGKGGSCLVKSQGRPWRAEPKTEATQSDSDCSFAAAFAQLFAVQSSTADAGDPNSRNLLGKDRKI